MEATYSISQSHPVTKTAWFPKRKKPFQRKKIHSFKVNRILEEHLFKSRVAKSFYTELYHVNKQMKQVGSCLENISCCILKFQNNS